MSAEDRLKQMMQAARTEPNATESEWNDFVRRAHRPLYARRAAAAVGALALVGMATFSAYALTTDGPDTEGPVQPVTTPTESPEPSPSGPDESAPIRVPFSEAELWFVHDGRLSWSSTGMGGEMSPGIAADDPLAQRAAFWLGILLGGPMGPHQEAGDVTAIPEGTKLRAVSREGSVLNVDLSSRFDVGGTRVSFPLRLAQVVYTGTQFEGVEAVRILVEGGSDPLGGEGRFFDISEPLTRRDFENVAPFVVVESPKPGAEISSPVTVAGFANVFEGTVSIRLVDRRGRVVVETFTTATCGNGCWGEFSEAVEYEIDRRHEGRLEVFTISAEDGTERDLTSIPVIIEP